MRQKLQLIAQTMLLIFLPAFILKPVLVSVENSLQMDACPIQKSICDSHADLIGAHATLWSNAREKSQVPTLMACFTKTILTSSEGRVLRFVSNSVCFSPQGFHVLRI